MERFVESAVRSIAALVLVVFAYPVAGATLTWDGGGSDSFWASAANWSSNQAPAAGDSLVFAGTVRPATSNNIEGLQVQGLTFSSTGSRFSIGGDAFTLGTGGIQLNTNQGAEILGLGTTGLTLSGSQTWAGTATTGTLTVGSTIRFTTGNQTLTIGGAFNTFLNAPVLQPSPVSPPRLVKTGTGTLTLGTTLSPGGAPGTQPYQFATIDVQQGTLTLSRSEQIQDRGSLTLSGGTFAVGTFTESIETIALRSGSITGTTGQLRIQGALTGSGTATLESGTVSASMSGEGRVVKSTAGNVTLTAANTYTGSTQINQGTLAIGASNVLPDQSAVSVASGATLSMGNFSDAIGSLAGAGTVSRGTGVLVVGGNGDTTTFSGVITGSGSLTKARDSCGFPGFPCAAAILTLSGANTYTGETIITGGGLKILATRTLVCRGGSGFRQGRPRP